MQISKVVLDAGAIISYMIEAWGSLPGLNDFQTSWVRHSIQGLSALAGLVLLAVDPVKSGLASPWNVAGLVLVGIGGLLSIPLILFRMLFWMHRIPDSKRIEIPIKYINKAANLISGLGLIAQLFGQ
jgi:hypothetical protein